MVSDEKDERSLIERLEAERERMRTEPRKRTPGGMLVGLLTVLLVVVLGALMLGFVIWLLWKAATSTAGQVVLIAAVVLLAGLAWAKFRRR